VIERALVLADGDTIRIEDLPESPIKVTSIGTPQVGQTLEEIEKKAIKKALEKAGGNQSRAARALGIPRHVLLYRMKKWGITRS